MIFKFIDNVFSNDKAREKERCVNNNSFYAILFMQFIESLIYHLLIFNIHEINTYLINFVNVFLIVNKRNFHLLILRYINNVINILL